MTVSRRRAVRERLERRRRETRRLEARAADVAAGMLRQHGGSRAVRLAREWEREPRAALTSRARAFLARVLAHLQRLLGR